MSIDMHNIVKKIKSRGYWEVNIRPDIHNTQRIEKQKVKNVVHSAVVELRGWDYPHFKDNEDPYPILQGIEKTSDWSNHIEFWRMTQSANFYHLLAVKEDWTKDIEYKNMWSRGDELKNKKWLGILNALYTLTEIFEFSKRLTSQGIFDENIIIEITLRGLENRMLVVDAYDRVPFSFPRVAKISEPWIYHTKTFLVNDLLNKANQFALDAFLDLVYLFSWENPPIGNLQNDQQKFLEGRI